MGNRRQFLISAADLLWVTSLGSLVGCGGEDERAGNRTHRATQVILYDTYAMALYMDGSLGPKTGVIKVQYIINGVPMTLDFWHGHGGRQHRFTLTAMHYQQLKQQQKVTIETTEVDGHRHKLFIDPVSPRWRVPGAQPIPVDV